MSQAFTTIFTKDYKWKEQKRTPICYPQDKFAEGLPEGDIWLVKKELEEEFGKDGLHIAEEVVKRMYRRRYITTYKQEFCRDMIQAQGLVREREELSENELVAQAAKLYTFPREEKILPPLPTTRRLFGYLRPSRMYIPLTTYQKNVGELAYDILRGVEPKKYEGDKNEAAKNENSEICVKNQALINEKDQKEDGKQSSTTFKAKSKGLRVYKYYDKNNDDAEKKMLCCCCSNN